MGRQPCCDKIGLKKGPWTSEEDKKLINFILTNGQCCWRALPKRAGLLRCGKSCRLRWTNYLRPDLKRGLLSEQEESLIIDLHSQLGNRWSKIASHLPGRTDNEIKNLWHTHIKKKLQKMGIDHLTHKQLPLPSDLHQSQEKPQEEMQNKNQELDTESTTTNTDGDHQAQENIDHIDNDFCIDEVPLIEPHEIMVPNCDLPSSSSSSTSFSTTPSISTNTNSFSSSNINAILEDLDIDMGFWNNYNDEDFSNWDISINDHFDMDNLDYGIIQST